MNYDDSVPRASQIAPPPEARLAIPQTLSSAPQPATSRAPSQSPSIWHAYDAFQTHPRRNYDTRPYLYDAHHRTFAQRTHAPASNRPPSAPSTTPPPTPTTPSAGCAFTPCFAQSHFTGKERDSESGNDYFGARYYSSSTGRFMSPDWSAKAEPVPYAKMDNPQSLNLYSYVLNNPMTGRDPDGHFCFLGMGNTCTPLPPPLLKTPDPAHVRPVNDHRVGPLTGAFKPAPAIHGATVGVGYGLNAEVGDGKHGTAATTNVNAALSMNDKQISTGLVDNHGAVAASGDDSAGTPQNGTPTIAGASGGISATVFVSNAKSLSDLVGPFQTTTYNLGVISFQYSTDSLTNVLSITAGSVGFSYTKMTTETTVGCISGCN